MNFRWIVLVSLTTAGCYGDLRTSWPDADVSAAGHGGSGGAVAGQAGTGGGVGGSVGGPSGVGGGGGGTGGTTCSTNAECSADFFCSEGRCISDVVLVATGGWHTCAVRKDGKLFCWGGNESAQVGVPPIVNDPSPAEVRPVEIPTTLSIRKLALGGGFSCAITADDRVACWGDDSNGQLGDGTAGGSRSTPAFVRMPDGTELTSVADMAAGSCSACALNSLGVGVYCWGCNNRSQIGRTTAATAQSPEPLLVPSSSAATLLAVGSEAAHFVGSDMVCGWGFNLGSPLSGATMMTFATPTCFALLSVQQTILGHYHGCARLASGAVQCWGLLLGSDTIVPPPGMAIPGIVATRLGGGSGHGCARDANANVRCWGSNGYGLLGDGTSQDSTVPTTVLDGRGDPLAGVLSDGLSISGTAQHTCAILGDGSLYCWGWNLLGQIGNGASNNSEPRAAPVKW